MSGLGRARRLTMQRSKKLHRAVCRRPRWRRAMATAGLMVAGGMGLRAQWMAHPPCKVGLARKPGRGGCGARRFGGRRVMPPRLSVRAPRCAGAFFSVPLLLGAQSKNIVWKTLRVREAGYVGLVAWSGGSMACLQSVWSQLQDHLPQHMSALYVCRMCLPYVSAVGVVSAAGPFATAHVCLICLPYVSALCVCSRCGLSCRTICR